MMKLKKSFGIFLIIIGALLLIGSLPKITGLTIFEVAGFDNRLGGVLGVLLVIVGVGMMVAGKKFDYYSARANELLKHKGDAWISQWESEGLLNEFKERGYMIEHGKDMPVIHMTGPSPRKRHVYIEKGEFGKHLFFTQDPADPRLKYIGVKEEGEKIKRIPSKVYHSLHPIKSGREKKKFTSLVEILGKNINK